MSETCTVSCQNKFVKISASGWLYYKEICYDAWLQKRKKLVQSLLLPSSNHPTFHTAVPQSTNLYGAYFTRLDRQLVCNLKLPPRGQSDPRSSGILRSAELTSY